MGKIREGLNSLALRTGNTLATPFRLVGELGSGVANVPRQGMSGLKNSQEVIMQTRDALTDNFLNFSKVKGKWYQKLLKVPLNLVSACTRRPAMIAGAGAGSLVNQGIRQPFKKLLLTPGKVFKGLFNATRIFSKKKGFDFQNYEVHETKNDTRISKMKTDSIGFLGVSAAKEGESKKGEVGKPVPEKLPKEEKKPEIEKIQVEVPVKKEIENKKLEVKKREVKKQELEIKKLKENSNLEKGTKERIKKMEKERNDKEVDTYLAERGYPPGEKFGTEIKKEPQVVESKKESPVQMPSSSPKTFDELNKKNKEEAEKKDKEEKNKSFPDWKTLDSAFKKEYRKEYNKTLGNKLNEEGIVERGKKGNLGTSSEEIIKNLKEKEPTFAGYLEQEVLSKTNIKNVEELRGGKIETGKH